MVTDKTLLKESRLYADGAGQAIDRIVGAVAKACPSLLDEIQATLEEEYRVAQQISDKATTNRCFYALQDFDIARKNHAS